MKTYKLKFGYTLRVTEVKEAKAHYNTCGIYKIGASSPFITANFSSYNLQEHKKWANEQIEKLPEHLNVTIENLLASFDEGEIFECLINKSGESGLKEFIDTLVYNHNLIIINPETQKQHAEILQSVCVVIPYHNQQQSVLNLA